MKQWDLQPPEEKPGFVCDNCGAWLLSGARAFKEYIYGDVVGCECCSEWCVPRALEAAPEVCPNCAGWLGDADGVLVSAHGTVLACDACAMEAYAVDVCRRIE